MTCDRFPETGDAEYLKSTCNLIGPGSFRSLSKNRPFPLLSPQPWGLPGPRATKPQREAGLGPGDSSLQGPSMGGRDPHLLQSCHCISVSVTPVLSPEPYC